MRSFRTYSTENTERHTLRPDHPPSFVSDIAIFVLKRDVKLQLTNIRHLVYYQRTALLLYGKVDFQSLDFTFDSYLRQGGYVIVVVCLFVSNFAQKHPNK